MTPVQDQAGLKKAAITAGERRANLQEEEENLKEMKVCLRELALSCQKQGKERYCLTNNKEDDDNWEGMKHQEELRYCLSKMLII